MSEFCVYRGEFLDGAVRAVLTFSDRGASIKWEPNEPDWRLYPAELRQAQREKFEREYHAWREACVADHMRRIGRTLSDEEKNAPEQRGIGTTTLR